MKTSITLFIAFFISYLTQAQPQNWENFSATSCNGVTQSIKGVLNDSLKPIYLIWEGYDCGFCREEAPQCAESARNYGNTVVYWNAFGRINGNGTCAEAADWGKEYGTPARNFVFLDKLAEDNWSQPAPGQGRWYFVITRDRVTLQPKIIYSGNIVKDGEGIARRATRDFLLSNDVANSAMSSFKLFPNPAENNIQLEIKLKSKALVVAEIVDLAGKSYGTILNGTFNYVNENIDLSTYKKGMYILNYKIDGTPYSQLLTIN